MIFLKTITIQNKPIIIHNEDFQTIQIQVIFPFPRDEEMLAYPSLLPRILHSVTSQYPTEREFTMATQRLFLLSSFCSYSSLIQDSQYSFHFMIPDTKALGEDLLEEQFQFFSEMIYHPKVENNRFCQMEFEREVQNLKMEIENTLQDPNSYAFIHAKKIVDPDGRFSSSLALYPEQIDEVTPEKLYQHYLDTIYNNQPVIYIFGNVSDQKMEELCQKYLYRTSFSLKTISIETKNYLPVVTPPKEVTQQSQFRDSVYLAFYKVKDMKEEDEFLLGVVRGLLSSLSSRLLSKRLRDEADLVYSCGASTYDNYGLLCIYASIHSDSVFLVQEKIQEVFEQLRDEELIAPLLQNIKDRLKVGLVRLLDDKTSLFQDAIIKDLKIDYSTEEYYQKIVTITPQDVILFLDRIVLDTKYFLKEGDHV